MDFGLVATICGWAAAGIFLYLGFSRWQRTNDEWHELYRHYLEGKKRKEEQS